MQNKIYNINNKNHVQDKFLKLSMLQWSLKFRGMDESTGGDSNLLLKVCNHSFHSGRLQLESPQGESVSPLALYLEMTHIETAIVPHYCMVVGLHISFDQSGQ